MLEEGYPRVMVDSLTSDGVFEYYSRVVARNVEWLWYPYIPFGKITVVEGDPGDGKSSFILQVAAILTTGSRMPDGYQIDQAAPVIYQCREDDLADTIKPRLLAAGAICDRVAYIIDEDNSLTLSDQRIITALEQTGARLLILDPLQAYMAQEGDMNNVGRIRSCLGRLSSIASKYRCAIVLIGHMNKSGGGKSVYRGLGSIDIAAVARSILMISRDADDPDIRYMFPIKSSLAPEGPAIGFRFDRDAGFKWLGICEANVSPDVLPPGNRVGKMPDATELLISMLADGELPSAEVLERMSMNGISERTVYKIKRLLGIESRKKGRVWYWRLQTDGEA